ncbi:MAG: hypothetical protein HPY55_09735 [Firmicutes bacterium]|nr:hypothetical protein [Bacillota bacterium]
MLDAVMQLGPYIFLGFLGSGVFLLSVTAPRLKAAGVRQSGEPEKGPRPGPQPVAVATGIGWLYIIFGALGLVLMVVVT